MEPLKKMDPLTTIAMRATACGAITCVVLAFVSHQLEISELVDSLHHEPTHLQKGWIQFIIIAIGVIVAFLIDKKDLRNSYQLSGQRGVWRSVVGVLVFFVLGFLLIGIILPSQV